MGHSSKSILPNRFNYNLCKTHSTIIAIVVLCVLQSKCTFFVSINYLLLSLFKESGDELEPEIEVADDDEDSESDVEDEDEDEDENSEEESSEEEEEEELFPVEKILRSKTVKKTGQVQYLVKWVGYDQPTWDLGTYIPKVILEDFLKSKK